MQAGRMCSGSVQKPSITSWRLLSNLFEYVYYNNTIYIVKIKYEYLSKFNIEILKIKIWFNEHFLFSERCFLKGVLYEHGELVSPKQCVECECKDGNMGCSRIDPEKKCPPLPCKLSEQISVSGECCKFCPGIYFFQSSNHYVLCEFTIPKCFLLFRCRLLQSRPYV